ncbi:predicted protein [Arabidopsis lyrata subsp. lyrata]|uniref:Predicted protein n=1 Tax=Arabidopsis lyrata subsp. lyrata TaxID=81972 RepID=D7KW32_ARALL|nr:predicted protein [Arabidopsis lyrata subsp. lyrata]
MDPTMMVLQKLMYEVVIQGSKHHHGQIRHPTYVFLGQQGYWTIEKWSSIYDGMFMYLLEFEINHLNNKHLECVEVDHDDATSGFIQGLQFRTNFMKLKVAGGKQWDNDLQVELLTFIISHQLESLDFTMIEMLEAIGILGGGDIGIQTIHFEYVKLKSGELFGVWDSGFTQTIEIDHLNNEHLESVEGYYNNTSCNI